MFASLLTVVRLFCTCTFKRYLPQYQCHHDGLLVSFIGCAVPVAVAGVHGVARVQHNALVVVRNCDITFQNVVDFGFGLVRMVADAASWRQCDACAHLGLKYAM